MIKLSNISMHFLYGGCIYTLYYISARELPIKFLLCYIWYTVRCISKWSLLVIKDNLTSFCDKWRQTCKYVTLKTSYHHCCSKNAYAHFFIFNDFPPNCKLSNCPFLDSRGCCIYKRVCLALQRCTISVHFATFKATLH